VTARILCSGYEINLSQLIVYLLPDLSYILSRCNINPAPAFVLKSCMEPALIQLGFIGGGVMAEAILSRLVQQQIFAAATILVSDPLAQRRDFLTNHYGVQVTAHNHEVIQRSPILILAIKPQQLSAIAQDFTTVLTSGSPATPALVISILAGVSLRQLTAIFPGVAIVRAMPNTPATVGAGITAMASGVDVTPAAQTQAQTILAAVGTVLDVPESQLDAVTGLSGSGPGYIALVVEALTDGGVAVGLPRAIAAQLALQTVWGTAQLLKESGWHPAELKDRVTSPGGTTIAGIAALEQAGLRAAMIAAVQAATQRSKELGK
jgi:pyrroline-5-carboxylate reductase